ncbi:hypothetical protein Ancab_021925 [Ancistrocladus abbreviatus]
MTTAHSLSFTDMDFFKPVFTDDPDPPSTTSKPESSSTSSHPQTQESDSLDSDQEPSNSNQPTPSSATTTTAAALEGGGGGWSFGGLMKTLSAKSESVIETYSRDLREFGSGLKKETVILREVASRAVRDLPTSIEIGTSRAQGSLESVGQAIDSIGSTVWKSTAEIIVQGKESLLSVDVDPDTSDTDKVDSRNKLNVQTVNSARYSRFDAQLRAIQCDVNTYTDEPENLDDYAKWKLGFDFEEKTEEIERLMRENGHVEGIYRRVVPNSMDHEVFWSRYYYKVHKLKQAEFVKADLVKTAISRKDEGEELSCNVDDDEEEKGNGSTPNAANLSTVGENLGKNEIDDMDSLKNVDRKKINSVDHNKEESSVIAYNSKEEGPHNAVGEAKAGSVPETASEQEVSAEKVSSEGSSEVYHNEKSADKVASERKTEASDSSKDSDISVISSHSSQEEEDLGWDKIEDIGNAVDKKESHGGSPSRAELRKWLSAAEEEEDLSWDTEDDEPVKA